MKHKTIVIDSSLATVASVSRVYCQGLGLILSSTLLHSTICPALVILCTNKLNSPNRRRKNFEIQRQNLQFFASNCFIRFQYSPCILCLTISGQELITNKIRGVTQFLSKCSPNTFSKQSAKSYLGIANRCFVSLISSTLNDDFNSSICRFEPNLDCRHLG